MPDPESPEDQYDLNDPAFFGVFERGRASARARESLLTELEKVQVIHAEAEAKEAQARAREAQHRAAMEPDRQRMALKERETRRWIGIGLAFAAPALLGAVIVFAPWVIPPAGIAAAFAYVRRGAGADPA